MFYVLERLGISGVLLYSLSSCGEQRPTTSGSCMVGLGHVVCFLVLLVDLIQEWLGLRVGRRSHVGARVGRKVLDFDPTFAKCGIFC